MASEAWLDQQLRATFRKRYGRSPSVSEFAALEQTAARFRARPGLKVKRLSQASDEIETPAALWFNVHRRVHSKYEKTRPKPGSDLPADGYLLDTDPIRGATSLLPVVRSGSMVFVMAVGTEGWRAVGSDMRFILRSELPKTSRFDALGRLLLRSPEEVRFAIHDWRDLPDRNH